MLSPEMLRKGFQLGRWTVYPDQNLIKEGSKEAHLEPKVMEVLVYLAANPGEVIKRDLLINSIWKTYVSDEVLSRAISLLRTSLEDDPKNPVFIQTVPRVGYRLIHEVTQLSKPPEVTSRKLLSKPWSTVEQLVATGVVVLALALLVVVQLMDKRSGGEAPANLAEWLDFLELQRYGTSEVISIAVLPFDNLSEAGSNAYYGDGLTDEITMSLSKVQGLKVVARRSSYSVKNRQDDVLTIGKLLNVDVVLEGSVRQTGDTLKINTHLSSARDGFLLWSKSYERHISDVFEVQGEVTSAIIEALEENTPGSNLLLPQGLIYQPNIEAYQLYLNGRFLWKLRGEQPLRESIGLFRQAVATDPQFTKAQLALASSLVLLPFYSSEPQEKMFAQALNIIDGIAASDPWVQSESESIRAFIAMHRWQWIEAETRYRKAIELAPDNTNVYVWYSLHLSSVGRNDDAVTAAERARELDAVSPVVNDRLGTAYLWQDDVVRAAEQFAIGRQLGFSNKINPSYIIFLIRQKRYLEFKSVIDALHPDPATKPEWAIENAHLLFLPENREMAVKLVTEAAKKGPLVVPQFIFGLWILIGGVDQAYETFNQFSGTPNSKHLYIQFLFAREGTAFREDARFRKLTKDIGLEAYWELFGEPDFLK